MTAPARQEPRLTDLVDRAKLDLERDGWFVIMQWSVGRPPAKASDL